MEHTITRRTREGTTVAAMLDFEGSTTIGAFGLRKRLCPGKQTLLTWSGTFPRARSEKYRIELRKGLLPHRNGVVRLMSYINHANMGTIAWRLRNFESGETAVPDITNHPFRTTTKYGFGANLEQRLNGWLTAFGAFWAGTKGDGNRSLIPRSTRL